MAKAARTHQAETKPQNTEATEPRGEAIAPVADASAETAATPVDVNQGQEPAQEIKGEEVESDTAGTGEAIKAEDDKSNLPPFVTTPQVSAIPETKTGDAQAPLVLHHGAVTMESISTAATPVDVNQGLTKVEINYPEDFEGQRHYKNGHIAFVSKESADAFVKAGIAKIV